MSRRNIFTYFEESYERRPHSEALFVNEISYSYKQIYTNCSRIAFICSKFSEGPFIGVFAHRSETAFSSILGILKAGHAYLPFNPKFPSERNETILKKSKLRTIIVGNECLSQALELIKNSNDALVCIFPDNSREELGELENHVLYAKEDLISGLEKTAFVEKDSFAYMLFTSGSTGEPKGVPINHINVKSYVDNINTILDFSLDDKFSNTFDLTFDLSVHDMFICWSNGGALYCLPEKALFGPAKYIKKNRLTVWFSVPSLVAIMNRLRMLKEDAFPDLQKSLFCGEALPLDLAQKWQSSALNSNLVNIYGPTEATIGITYFFLPRNDSDLQISGLFIVPIGKIFEDQDYLILDEDNNVVVKGGSGELCLSGSQLSKGYWNDSGKTDEVFIRINSTRWYKTGDIVREDAKGVLHFIERKDSQVKINGYRVELMEIDTVLLNNCNLEQVATIALRNENDISSALYTFIVTQKPILKTEIYQICRKKLPAYMIPNEIFFIDALPLNSNGKIDRKQLEKLVKK